MDWFASLWNTLIAVLLGACTTWFIGYRQQVWLWRRFKDAIRGMGRVSLNEQYLMTRELASQIRKANFAPDVIFAINPGGGMIAEWLSRACLGDFEKPIPVKSLCIRSKRLSGGIEALEAYVDLSLGDPVEGISEHSKILLVNDISRGGHTLLAAYRHLLGRFQPENVLTATLFSHKFSSIAPKACVVFTEQTVLFDWKQSRNI
jgi:hypoxanthine phosphoribosyltransferase